MSAPSLPDISNLDYGQLCELKVRIGHRLVELRETEAPRLREKFAQQAAAIGMMPEEILGTAKKAKRQSSKAKRTTDTSLGLEAPDNASNEEARDA